MIIIHINVTISLHFLITKLYKVILYLYYTHSHTSKRGRLQKTRSIVAFVKHH